MLLISSASNPELHLVLGFSNLVSFWLILLSSQLLFWYHSVLCWLFLLLNPFNHSAVLSCFFHIIPCYSKIVYSFQHLVFHYWYFLYNPSVDKLFPDFRLTFCWPYTRSLSPHISSALLFLHVVTVSPLLSLFLFLFLCYTSFQAPHIFLSSLLLLFGDVLRCLCVSWLCWLIF